MSKFEGLTIFDAANRIKNGDFTSEELVSYHLELAKSRGKELNAFVTVVETAIDKAKAIDKKIKSGEKIGKLAGIPFTAKDILMTDGIQSSAGSQLLNGFIGPYTATTVQKLLDEDAILIGKTNCDPFAFGASGENSGFGPTLNPVDESRVPGGSSSGAAAAQAAGIGLFGLGTDTGGSVRQPAGFCGVVGFKPTYGRNSRYGLIAMASSFDTVGIFASTIKEVALIEQVIAGKDTKDATSYDIPVPDYIGETEKNFDLKGLKIGVPKEFFAQGIDKEVEEKVRFSLMKLEDAGAELIDISIPLMKYGIAVYYVLVPSEISSNMARFDGVRYGRKVSDDYKENMYKGRGQFMEDEVKRRVMIGTYTLSAGYSDQYYNQASKVRVKLTEEIAETFENVDVIMGPTSPTVAFKLGERTDDPVQMYLADVYTVVANLTGVPAISINCGENSEGLPIGLQMMTAKFEESKLFQIANAYENL